LVVSPKILRTQEEVRRKADKRLAEWGKDQEEYAERGHQLAEQKREEDRRTQANCKPREPGKRRNRLNRQIRYNLRAKKKSLTNGSHLGKGKS
jgi:hypothetical protein